MFQMLEKGINGGICHLIIDMQQQIMNLCKTMPKTENCYTYSIVM